MTSVLPTPSDGAVAARHVSQFHELTQRISAAGLMRRRYGFYWGAFSAAVLALAGLWTGAVLLGDSWLQLILAAALGLIFAQLGFLGNTQNTLWSLTGIALSIIVLYALTH